MVNLSSFIFAHARRAPDAVALIYQGDRVTYAQFARRIRAVAGWLAAHGVHEGDVVALVMRNSPAFLELAFAVSHLGAVFLPINFRLAGDEIAYILANSDAKLLFVDEEHAAQAQGAPTTKVVDAAARADLSRICAGEAPAMAVRKPSDLFRLMYTSGTTDRPKGVIHTYENFYWKSADHLIALGFGKDTRLLLCGPLYHVGAFDLPGIAVLWAGGTICMHRDFDPAAVLASIEAEQLNGAWLAPVMMTALLSPPDRGRFDVSSLRWVIGGGDRTPESRIRSFSIYFRNARYIDAYGLTEGCAADPMMGAGREFGRSARRVGR